eukprot:TRINITY_DN2636_c0_g1_i3.p2 TRINITY_DN2636_c0_g1~~TRINITY_DN2636_c0_g1_i3.p2  ORF type:complete len:504 (+),score=197.17 TRINITY_DN2636_c0_g1_i3:19-1530(+)
MVTTMPLMVKVVRATDLLGADRNGLSDPLCKIKLRNSKPQQKFQTKSIDKTLDPVWNEEFKFMVFVDDHINNFLELSVYDKDWNGQDFLGGCLIQLDDFMDGKIYEDIEYPLSGQDVEQGSVFLSFRPANKQPKTPKKEMESSNNSSSAKSPQKSKETIAPPKKAEKLAEQVKKEELGVGVGVGVGKAGTEKGNEVPPPIPAKKSGLFQKSGSSGGLFGRKKTTEEAKQVKENNNANVNKEGAALEVTGDTSSTTTSTTDKKKKKKEDDKDNKDKKFFDKVGEGFGKVGEGFGKVGKDLESMTTNIGSGIGNVFVKKKDRKKETVNNREVSLVSGDMRITVMNAKNLRAADKGGTSDPYVSMKYGWQMEETTVIKKSLNPVWDETFLFEFHSTDNPVIVMDVWDMDVLGNPDFLGRTELNLKDLAGVDQQVELPLLPRTDKEKAAKKAQGSIELFLEFSKVTPEMVAAVKVDKSRKPATPPNGSFDLLIVFVFALMVWLYGTL